MITRRQFMKTTAGAAGALAASGLLRPGRAHAFAQSPNLQKFLTPLRQPGLDIPLATSDGTRTWGSTVATHYTIDINEFQDQLHPALPSTTLWGYNPSQNATQKHLGGIIATKRDNPVQITFRNNLPAKHIIPLDTTIPGANQAQNRTAVHLHGGYVPWISDGGPFDWWAPNGSHGLSFLNNTVLNPGALSNEAEYYYPNGQSARLVWYHDHAWGITRINAYAGVASGYVIYDDYETMTLGGPPYNLPGPLDPRTQYLIFQDKIFVDPTTIPLSDPTWPIVMPNANYRGALWYAHVYDPTRWALGPGGAPPNPSVIAEYFGDTILVNGAVYPYLEVEQRQYRFRLLNACNARFLNPRLVYAQSNVIGTVASTEPSPNAAGPAFIQFGTEGGFLPAPAMLNGPKQPLLLLAPAERADLIIDFSLVPAGSVLILYNDAPAPFPKGDGRNDYYPNNPKTPTSIPGSGPNTRTLMQIRVKARNGAANPAITFPATLSPTDPFLIPQTVGVPTAFTLNGTGGATIALPAGGTLTVDTFRQLTLNETFDTFGRLIQYLGTNQAVVAGKAALFGREYISQATEVVKKDAVEIWEIANLTGDVHPIHFHLVNVQILSRQPFNVKGYAGVPNYLGPAVGPDANELGWKETVRMNPGEVIRVLMKFTLPPTVPFPVPTSPRIGNGTPTEPGLGNVLLPGTTKGHEYVWHCHILEHEEHDMMRPLVVCE